RKLSVLAKQISVASFDAEDQKLLVVNTSQLAVSSVITTAIYFLEEDQVQAFSIEDEAGQQVPYRIVSEYPSRVAVLSPINLPGMMSVKRFDIEWQPQAPALGYRTYRVRKHQSGNRAVDVASHAQ